MFFAITPSFITLLLYAIFPLAVIVASKKYEFSDDEREKFRSSVSLISLLLAADILFYLVFRGGMESASARLLLLFHAFIVLAAFILSRTLLLIFVDQPDDPVFVPPPVAQPEKIPPPAPVNPPAQPERIVKPLIVEKVEASWSGLVVSPEVKQRVQFCVEKSLFPLLLFGPAGNGREMIAKIIAHSLGLRFMKIELSQFVGKTQDETDGNIESLVTSLKSTAPLLVYVPNIHSIFAWNHENWVSNRTKLIVQELLVDGKNLGLTIIANTDNQDAMKEWLLQSESFEAVIEVPLPTPQERVALAKREFEGFTFEDEIAWEGFEENTLSRSVRDILWVAQKTKQLSQERTNNPQNKKLHRDDLAYALEALLKNPP